MNHSSSPAKSLLQNAGASSPPPAVSATSDSNLLVVFHQQQRQRGLASTATSTALVASTSLPPLSSIVVMENNNSSNHNNTVSVSGADLRSGTSMSNSTQQRIPTNASPSNAGSLSGKSSTAATVAIVDKNNNNNHVAATSPAKRKRQHRRNNNSNNKKQLGRGVGHARNHENNSDEDEEAADSDDQRERSEERHEQLEARSAHLEMIMEKFSGATLVWRHEFATLAADLVERLATPLPKAWNREVVVAPSPPHHQHQHASNHRQFNNRTSGGGGGGGAMEQNLAAGASQLDTEKIKHLKDNATIVNMELFFASLLHRASSSLPVAAVSGGVTEHEFFFGTDAQRKQEEARKKNQKSAATLITGKRGGGGEASNATTSNNSGAAIAVATAAKTQAQREARTGGVGSGVESDPHVLVTAGACYAYEEHLCSLYEPPYNALCRRAIQELQTQIYWDYKRCADCVTLSDLTLLAAQQQQHHHQQQQQKLVANRYVRLTWCQLFTYLCDKARAARSMIHFKENTLTGQMGLLDRTVHQWRCATSLRVLREWRGFTMRQKHLRRRYRETFVTLSTTATVRRAISNWRAVCRAARERFEDGGDAGGNSAGAVTTTEERVVIDENGEKKTIMVTTTTNAAAARKRPSMLVSADGMAHATVRALQGQLVVRGSMLDHLGNVVKALRAKSVAQLDSIEACLQRQARVYQDFVMLLHTLFPPQGHLRCYSPEDWEALLKQELEDRNDEFKGQMMQTGYYHQGSFNNNNNNGGSGRLGSGGVRPASMQLQQSSGGGKAVGASSSRRDSGAFGPLLAENSGSSAAGAGGGASGLQFLRPPPLLQQQLQQQQQQQQHGHLIPAAARLARGVAGSGAAATTTTTTTTLHYDQSNHSRSITPDPFGAGETVLEWHQVLATNPRTSTRASHILIRVRHLLSILCIMVSSLQRDLVQIVSPPPLPLYSAGSHLHHHSAAATGGGNNNNNNASQQNANNNNNNSSNNQAAVDQQDPHMLSSSDLESSANLGRNPSYHIAKHMSGSTAANHNDARAIVTTFMHELDVDTNDQIIDNEINFVRALLSSVNRVAFSALYVPPSQFNERGATIGDSDHAVTMHHQFLTPSSWARVVEFDNSHWVGMLKSCIHVLFAMCPLPIPKMMLLMEHPAAVAAAQAAAAANAATPPHCSPASAARDGASIRNSGGGGGGGGGGTASAASLSASSRLGQQQQQQLGIAGSSTNLGGAAAANTSGGGGGSGGGLVRRKSLILFPGQPLVSAGSNIATTASSSGLTPQQQQQQLHAAAVERNIKSFKKKALLAATAQKQGMPKFVSPSLRGVPSPAMPSIPELRKEWERSQQLCAENRWQYETCNRHFEERARQLVAEAFERGQSTQMVAGTFDQLVRCSPRMRHSIPGEFLLLKLKLVFGEELQSLSDVSGSGGGVASGTFGNGAPVAAGFSTHVSGGHVGNNNINGNMNIMPSGYVTATAAAAAAQQRYGGSGGANKGAGATAANWRSVLQGRKVIQDSHDLEFVLHSISKLTTVDVAVICERLSASLDDTDLFFVALSSTEVQTVLLEHAHELNHLFMLNATRRKATEITALTGTAAAGAGASPTSPSLPATSHSLFSGDHYHSSSSSGSMTNHLHHHHHPFYMSRDDFVNFCKQWCDAFLSVGALMDIFVRTVQRFNDDARGVASHQQQGVQLLMGQELFPCAMVMVAATKFANPFVPLKVKLKTFMIKMLVPLANQTSGGAVSIPM